MGLFRIRGLEERRLKPFLSSSTHLLNQSRSLQALPAYDHQRSVFYIASLVFRRRTAASCARSPRLFSSVSSYQQLKWREEQQQSLSSFIKDDRQDRFRLQQDKPGRFVPVRAFFLSTRSLVDGMVAEFTDINHEMKKIGTFTVKKEKLFQLVGKANSSLADVILKLGLFER
ncbi:hypothetical protein B296_00051626 [Ensete ventricosum]|uniref:Uncharacterized protein n=1 Tax=Ensete ventricosum TaxID=4639 RepID=A0A426Y0V3_ENSVE|nr:hypothetical protein B296_00051626 [Ensete ventricosum]